MTDDNYTEDTGIPPREIIYKCLMSHPIIKKSLKQNVSDNTIKELANDVWFEFEKYARNEYGDGEYIAGVIFSINGGLFAKVKPYWMGYVDDDNNIINGTTYDDGFPDDDSDDDYAEEDEI